MNTLYAHGKLLLSAEYMVMYGSGALAVPLTQGQSLQRIRSESAGIFSWKAYHHDQLWFSTSLESTKLKIVESSDPEKSEYLIRIIRSILQLTPSFQEDLFKWDVETHLDFSPQWGLGSSSTLTALMAEWAEVNPLDLHFLISEGSGYDVACAIANGPILYKIRDYSPHYMHVQFHPPFADQLYFAWLGNKQITASHLEQIKDMINPDFEHIHHFSTITDQMIVAPDLGSFQALMNEHEEALSDLLGIEPISTTRFQDLPGTVKSLGAWGGDFVMIASDTNKEEITGYLNEREIKVVFRYSELVYDSTEYPRDETGI